MDAVDELLRLTTLLEEMTGLVVPPGAAVHVARLVVGACDPRPTDGDWGVDTGTWREVAWRRWGALALAGWLVQFAGTRLVEEVVEAAELICARNAEEGIRCSRKKIGLSTRPKSGLKPAG